MHSKNNQPRKLQNNTNTMKQKQGSNSVWFYVIEIVLALVLIVAPIYIYISDTKTIDIHPDILFMALAFLLWTDIHTGIIKNFARNKQ